MMEAYITTTVRIDKEDYDWVRNNDTTWRAVVKAGIKRLKEGPQMDSMREQNRLLLMEQSRNTRRKAILEWLFYNDPEAYEKAVKNVLQQEGSAE